jgi:hypothetical protein
VDGGWRKPGAGATGCHWPVGSEPPPPKTQARTSRPAQQGAAVVAARGASSLNWRIFFSIFFQGRPRTGRFPLLLLPRPATLPPQRLLTSHGRSYRNIGYPLLAGPLHPLRASRPGVPDATMHATVHTHHLGNSKLDSTTVRLLLLHSTLPLLPLPSSNMPDRSRRL